MPTISRRQKLVANYVAARPCSLGCPGKGTWDESLESYRGRAHGRMERICKNADETKFAVRSQQRP